MKKFLMVLCAVMMVFGMVGTAGALSFTDTQIFSSENFSDNFDEYTHTVPKYILESSIIDSMTLEFTTNKGLEDEFEITIEGEFVDEEWIFTTEYEWLNVTWEIGDVLRVRLDDKEFFNLTSKFTLDYEPVPEPSTILLVGTGILGLVGYNRKRFSKKS
jgi:hypothetical protein